MLHKAQTTSGGTGKHKQFSLTSENKNLHMGGGCIHRAALYKAGISLGESLIGNGIRIVELAYTIKTQLTEGMMYLEPSCAAK